MTIFQHGKEAEKTDDNPNTIFLNSEDVSVPESIRNRKTYFFKERMIMMGMNTEASKWQRQDVRALVTSLISYLVRKRDLKIMNASRPWRQTGGVPPRK